MKHKCNIHETSNDDRIGLSDQFTLESTIFSDINQKNFEKVDVDSIVNPDPIHLENNQDSEDTLVVSDSTCFSENHNHLDSNLNSSTIEVNQDGDAEFDANQTIATEQSIHHEDGHDTHDDIFNSQGPFLNYPHENIRGDDSDAQESFVHIVHDNQEQSITSNINQAHESAASMYEEDILVNSNIENDSSPQEPQLNEHQEDNMVENNPHEEL